ncbi:hypothetical protein D3C87_1719060 [compost metagenome]
MRYRAARFLKASRSRLRDGWRTLKDGVELFCLDLATAKRLAQLEQRTACGLGVCASHAESQSDVVREAEQLFAGNAKFLLGLCRLTVQ